MILSFRAKFDRAERSRGISRSFLSTAPGNNDRFLDFVLLLQNFARNGQ
jgi:hypothetical protein